MIFGILLRVIVIVYDFITLPIYLIVQRPWIQMRKQSVVWGGPLLSKRDAPVVRYTPDVMRAQFKGLETIDSFFRHAVKKYGDRPCFGTRVCKNHKYEIVDGKRMIKYELGDYRWKTFKEADAAVEALARGLTTLGLLPYSRLVIFAETREEWMLVALACFRRAIVVCTIYATLGDDGLVHGVNETEVKTIITTEELLPRLVNLMPRLPAVTHVVCMPARGTTEPPPPMNSATVLPLESLMNANPTEEMPQVMPKPQDSAIIMYTSGSTGQPKGVVLTNGNVVAFILGIASVMREFTCGDRFVAFLPLAHVMEIACEITFMSLGLQIGYSSPFTLTDQGTALMPGVIGDTSLLKPTAMIAVPLLLNRIRKAIEQELSKKSPILQEVFAFAQTYKSYWKKKGFTTPILNRIIFRGSKQILGGHLRALVSGSAPLSSETQEFLSNCLDCPVLQGYGLTETTAGATLQDLYDLTVGVVGPPLNGVQIKLVDWEEGGYHVADRPYPRGEVVVGGPTVAAGYYLKPELTAENFKDDGQTRWFYTGDIGEFLPKGLLRIIDRKKDLVKLQNGEYVSLGKIEMVLKTHPLVDNACVCGSSLCTFVVALIQPNEATLKRTAKSLSIAENESLPQLCENPILHNAVTNELTNHCTKSNLVKYEVPLKYKLCKEVWTPETELVTAALKIRRTQIQKLYHEDIQAMYRGVSNAASATDLLSSRRDNSVTFPFEKSGNEAADPKAGAK
ncbi:fatty acid CoA ligase Acsl3 isoform X1 [Rhipicephalus microplus]|uniref:fatty acid CoA ligase Acsl3 isoform X1 n=2 Tax=Rhipicephalus microplus TaxID=6941 RepID=UPI002376ADF2